MAYQPYKYDENQIPVVFDPVEGKVENIPFGTTIQQVADATAVTGLDVNQVQIALSASNNNLYVSPIGASTFTIHFAPAV